MKCHLCGQDVFDAFWHIKYILYLYIIKSKQFMNKYLQIKTLKFKV